MTDLTTEPTPCSLCGDTIRAVQKVYTGTGQGPMNVCWNCIGNLVADALYKKRRWNETFCPGCPQYHGDGQCAQGVTPETCA